MEELPEKQTVKLVATVVIYDTVLSAEEWKRQLQSMIRESLMLARRDEVIVEVKDVG